jgi:D-serine deaminase-like pyridoxal phosphate-dependent protein
MMRVADLSTPALVVDANALARNLDTMASALPAARLRPHVKAHKCTSLAREQLARGHTHFTCATPSEVVGMARAGIGDDVLLANQTVDTERLRAMADCGTPVTVAVDSEATIAAAGRNGIKHVLIDVNVGMPRCGCAPEDAGRLADAARAAGMEVRGVMGYEGHVVGLTNHDERVAETTSAMALLARAQADVGGDVISAGGTGTYAVNTYATEIQAGSYALMDSAYAQLGLPFEPAFTIAATVIHAGDTYAVADCGLKALSMDHGNPEVDDANVWFCSDEHVTFASSRKLNVGDRVFVRPAHVDPTIAMHTQLHLADALDPDAALLDTWPIDLRGWAVDR